MYACGKEFNDEVIARIIGTVEQEPSISRRSLSRLVCGWLDWRAPNGSIKDMIPVRDFFWNLIYGSPILFGEVSYGQGDISQTPSFGV